MKSLKWLALLGVLLTGLLAVGGVAAQTADGVLWQVDYFDNFYAEGPSEGGGQLGGPIALVWRDGSPMPGMPNNGWTARLTANAYFPEGRYRFRMLVDDGAGLKVSGIDLIDTLVFDQHSLGCAVYADMTLAEGIHQVQITYLENEGDASLFFNWQPLTQYTTNEPVYHGCNPPNQATGITQTESAALNSDPANNPAGADFSAQVGSPPAPVAEAPTIAEPATITEPAFVAATNVTSARVIVGTLNVRDMPDVANSQVIGKASFGDVYQVTGRSGENWYEIAFNGQTGYVSSRFVSVR